MNANQENALEALSKVFVLFALRASTNLIHMQNAQASATATSQLEPYPLDILEQAQTFQTEFGTSYVQIAAIEGTSVDYNLQEYLVSMASSAATCNRLADNPNNLLNHPESQGSFFAETQNITIRAMFLKHFTMFAIEHTQSRTAETLFDPNEECAKQHFHRYESNLTTFANYSVDKALATSIVKSQSFPMTPCIITNKIEPDCKPFNHIWMPVHQRAEMIANAATEQTAEFLQQAG